MRLSEFDDIDKTASKTKFGISIEDKLDEIKNLFANGKTLVSNFTINKIGSKEKIIVILKELINKIEEFYDFCNDCNDDTETRQYLNALIEMHNKTSEMIDSL